VGYREQGRVGRCHNRNHVHYSPSGTASTHKHVAVCARQKVAHFFMVLVFCRTAWCSRVICAWLVMYKVQCDVQGLVLSGRGSGNMCGRCPNNPIALLPGQVQNQVAVGDRQ
jgi:hypothetical protein